MGLKDDYRNRKIRLRLGYPVAIYPEQCQDGLLLCGSQNGNFALLKSNPNQCEAKLERIFVRIMWASGALRVREQSKRSLAAPFSPDGQATPCPQRLHGNVLSTCPSRQAFARDLGGLKLDLQPFCPMCRSGLRPTPDIGTGSSSLTQPSSVERAVRRIVIGTAQQIEVRVKWGTFICLWSNEGPLRVSITMRSSFV